MRSETDNLLCSTSAEGMKLAAPVRWPASLRGRECDAETGWCSDLGPVGLQRGCRRAGADARWIRSDGIWHDVQATDGVDREDGAVDRPMHARSRIRVLRRQL